MVVDERRGYAGVDRDPGDADVVDSLGWLSARPQPRGSARGRRRLCRILGRGVEAGAVLRLLPGGSFHGTIAQGPSGSGEVGADPGGEPTDRRLALVQRAAAVAGRLQAVLDRLDQLDVLFADEVVDADS